MATKGSGFDIPLTLSHHEYTHRAMRILSTIHLLEVKEGFPKDEFLIRSCMISNILVAEMMDKLSIEAGTLSYIPQYCDMTDRKSHAHPKELADNFGKKVVDLVTEVEELRMDFINDYKVDGYSRYAKQIASVHIYLDLVNMLNPSATVKVIDGEVYEILTAKKKLFDIYEDDEGKHKEPIEKGDQYIIFDEAPMAIARYYQYMVDVSKWKMGELNYTNLNFKQSVAELCMQIQKQRGVIVQ